MATIKKYVKCPHCGSGCMTDVEVSLVKFFPEKKEVLQKECLRLRKRFDNLQLKHDEGYLSNWQLEETNNKLSTLEKILDILENHL